MTYILILFVYISSYRGPTVTTLEFSSKENCMAAGTETQAKYKAWGGVIDTWGGAIDPVLFLCVPK
jgi:hypothetical protein